MIRVKGPRAPTSSIFFKNATLIDGTGREPLTGGLLVQGDRIKDVGRIDPDPDTPGIEVIDLTGRTLMPGMVLGHVHLGYHDVCDFPDLDLRQPPEVATITAVCNARTMLQCGFTAGLSAGALHRVDIHLRDAINAGQVPGPRLLAAGRDLCQTAGMLDWNPSWLQLGMEGLGEFVDGPWEVRKAVRRLIKDGADLVKMHAGGEGLRYNCRQTEVTCTREEIEALVEETHRRERLCSVDARTAEGCRLAVAAGVDLIDHATMIDDQSLDRLAAAGTFVVPAIDYLVTTLEHARHSGFARFGSYNDFLDRTRYEEELDAAVDVVRQAYRRGVKVLVGGDWGFAWCPHGTYGRELTHLVKLVGFRPMDALVAATRLGAEAMRIHDQIGTLKPGKLADLLVIEGNPLHDIALLEDPRNISHVMKGGRFVRRPVAEPMAAYA